MGFLLDKAMKNRRFVFLAFDAAFIIFAFILAFLLRFDGTLPGEYLGGTLQEMIIIALIFCLPVFNSFGLYDFAWTYVSTSELVALFKALTASFFLFGITLLIFRDWEIIDAFPRSTVLISYVLIFILSGAIRLSKRIYLSAFKSNLGSVKTLIVGAGDAGEQALRGIRYSSEKYYLPVGFVDDSSSKKGITIHGLPVLGVLNDIPRIVEDEQVGELIIALPSAGKNTIKRAVDLGRKANIKKIKIIPSIADIISGEIVLGNLREVSIEDLLGRESVKIDTKSIEQFIKGKTVLITGAAGSIGSELSMQVAKFSPSQLILLDQDETGIFNIYHKIYKKMPQLKLNPVIADVCDSLKIKKVFNQFKPAVVFHAAAYKHVPLMEENSDEAVKNNVFGTKNIAEISLESKVEKFVFVSTDKSVNPTSVMGATKRLGEMICQILNQKNGTKFISVRFGNVLDSRGSVIPIFREKILRREALEVTHPDMKRYFMMIPEACLLVMQAGQMGNGGEVFVLDMGEPIKIVDLAKEMIRLAGLEPDKDIPIVFCGVRPGEKLFEEILTAEEGTIATQNQSIFSAKLSHIEENNLKEKLGALKNILENGSEKEKITAVLKEIIPVYK